MSITSKLIFMNFRTSVNGFILLVKGHNVQFLIGPNTFVNAFEAPL